jgi:hypothetical protein
MNLVGIFLTVYIRCYVFGTGLAGGIIRKTKQLTRGELSMGRALHGASCPCGELSLGRAVQGANRPWGKLSMGQAVQGASCHGAICRRANFDGASFDGASCPGIHTNTNSCRKKKVFCICFKNVCTYSNLIYSAETYLSDKHK